PVVVVGEEPEEGRRLLRPEAGDDATGARGPEPTEELDAPALLHARMVRRARRDVNHEAFATRRADRYDSPPCSPSVSATTRSSRRSRRCSRRACASTRASP